MRRAPCPPLRARARRGAPAPLAPTAPAVALPRLLRVARAACCAGAWVWGCGPCQNWNYAKFSPCHRCGASVDRAIMQDSGSFCYEKAMGWRKRDRRRAAAAQGAPAGPCSMGVAVVGVWGV